MVRILTSDRTSITLFENLPVARDTPVSPNYWNPLYKGFTNIRSVSIPKDQFHEYFLSNDYTIVTLISHEAMNSLSTKVTINGKDYIDEFGKNVYINCALAMSDWKDVDLRYDENLEPELFKLEYVEYDISDREAFGPNGRV